MFYTSINFVAIEGSNEKLEAALSEASVHFTIIARRGFEPIYTAAVDDILQSETLAAIIYNGCDIEAVKLSLGYWVSDISWAKRLDAVRKYAVEMLGEYYRDWQADAAVLASI